MDDRQASNLSELTGERAFARSAAADDADFAGVGRNGMHLVGQSGRFHGGLIVTSFFSALIELKGYFSNVDRRLQLILVSWPV